MVVDMRGACSFKSRLWPRCWAQVKIPKYDSGFFFAAGQVHKDSHVESAWFGWGTCAKYTGSEALGSTKSRFQATS